MKIQSFVIECIVTDENGNTQRMPVATLPVAPTGKISASGKTATLGYTGSIPTVGTLPDGRQVTLAATASADADPKVDTPR